ncbi:MAG: hypothetical protein ACJAT7_003119 [Psychromonas sp.]
MLKRFKKQSELLKRNIKVKKCLALIFSLLLLTACSPSNSNENKNQFTFSQGGLYFSQRLITNWAEEIALPVCHECTKQTDKKYTADGPMLFRQINNGNGDLVFLYVTGAQHNFALKTGSAQYSVHLKMADKKLSLSVNQQQIQLKLNDIIELKLGTQNYSILLEKLKFINDETQSLASKPARYQANILIWLNNN